MTNNDSPLGIPEGTAVAVIGMAGRFPGADNIDEYWANLRNGVDCISRFSDEELLAAGVDPSWLKHPNYVKARGLLRDFDRFDASFFGYSPRDAEIMDPQHRALLETSWTALEHAGYYAERFRGLISVFAGVGLSKYLIMNLSDRFVPDDPAQSYQIFVGNDKDFAPTRVSYKLNLKGPSMSVQTACSTSLVAVHMACQSLLRGECDMALAGGASVHPEKAGYFFQEGMVLSPDGHCRAFDAKGHGFVPGSGAAIVVLKRLEDALLDRDTLHAIIRGSAVNNDGSLKVGFAASSLDGQVAAMAEALAVSGVDRESIGYIEAHGTATPLGDPIEVAALTKAYGGRRSRCAIGSVKTNIGHLDTAAGAASLIKTVLMLKHRQLVPSLHFEQPNPKIDFASSPFFVNTRLASWDENGGRRRAAINSLGMGGTNAHLILEEAPALYAPACPPSWTVLPLSAATAAALETSAKNHRQCIAESGAAQLSSIAYTLQVGRKPMRHRRASVVRDLIGASSELWSPESVRTFDGEAKDERNVVFMFPGQGAQHANMGLELYQTENFFRHQVDQCLELLRPDMAIQEIGSSFLYPAGAAPDWLTQTEYVQPALFVVEYALAKLWMHWGVQPSAFIGHSIGEYVAACLAGVFTLEDALKIVAKRGQLMQSLPPGAMLSVGLSEAELLPRLTNALSLAAVNGQSRCVAAGPQDAILKLKESLENERIQCTLLKVSHAFHSLMTEPVLETFRQFLSKFEIGRPRIPYVSNLTGRRIDEAEVRSPEYWVRHLRHTVRFSDGLTELAGQEGRVFLEVGPGRTLCSLVDYQFETLGGQQAIPSLRHPKKESGDVEMMMSAAAKMWTAGINLDWSKLRVPLEGSRVPLPGYPFERKRHWIPARNSKSAPPLENGSIEKVARQVEGRSEAVGAILTRSSQEGRMAAINDLLQCRIAARLGLQRNDIADNLRELPWDSLLIIEFVSALRKELAIELKPSEFFRQERLAELTGLIYKRLTGDEPSELPSHGPANTTAKPDEQGKRNAWFPFTNKISAARSRIFVFTGSGGSAAYYQKLLARGIPEKTEICVLQPPGRPWDRLHETPLGDLPSLVSASTDQIQGLLDRPFIFVGHSFGGLVAFEVARELRRRKRSAPNQLIVCACKSPQDDSAPSQATLSESETLKMQFGGEGIDELRNDRVLIEAVMGAYRNDVKLYKSYSYTPELPLEIPTVLLAGKEDKLVPLESVKGWRKETSVECEIEIMPCDHAFASYVPKLFDILVRHSEIAEALAARP